MEAHIQSLIAEDKNLDRFRIKDIQLGDRGGLSIITELKEAGGVVKTFKADFDSVNMVIDESGKLVGDLDQKLESGFSSGKFTAKIKDTTGEIDTLQSKASKALDSFEKKFKDSSNFSKIKRQVDSLRGSIDKIGDQSGLDKWLGRLNKAEDKIKNLDIVSSLRAKAKQSISKLESELKSSSNYSQISAPLKELKKEIKNINSQGDLDALISKLSALKTTVKDSDSFQSKASKALSTFMLNNKDSGGFSQVEGQLEALKGTITSINSQADLDRFNEQLKEIEHNLRRINAVSRFHVNDIEVISQYEELYNTLKKIGSLKIKLEGLNQGTEQYKLLKTEIDALEVAYDKLLAKFREHPDYGSFVADVEQELANVRKETEARVKEIEEKRINKNKTYQQSAQDAMDRFTSENQKDPFFSQIRKGVDALRDSISQIDSGEKLKKFNNDLSAIKSNFRTIKADNKLGEILSDGRTFKNISEVRANIDSLFASVGKVNEKSIRINGANKLTAEVKMANGEIHKMNVSLDSNNFARYVDAGIVQFGRLRGAAEKAFKGIWQMMRIYISPYRFVQLIRQGVNQIKEMDTAITELRKVSDAPMADISAYFDDAVASSKELGSSVKDMIGATADWARLGYNLPDSRELGEVAVLYKNVGDGISVDEANSSLVSTLKGFQMDADEALKIVDSFNEVANNYAIDSAGIGESLKRSAAAFNVANTSLNKSIALVTATNEVVQNPEKVGTLYQTISARIRGAKTELEDMGADTDDMVESTSKLRDLVKGMTGFDILQEDGKTYKDIYEIILGIGKEFDRLADIDRAALLEALAGKRQSNALAAVLGNLDTLEKSYKTAEESAGSAYREQRKYQESIQYSLDQLTAHGEEFWHTFLAKDDVKEVISLINSLIGGLTKLVDTIGSIPTLGVTLGGIAAFKNIGRPKMFGLKTMF